MTNTVAIWAEGVNREGQPIIGNSATNSLPWGSNSSDLQHFRRVTRDRVLVMGRRTFESLPPTLKNARSTFERPFIILTHEPQSIRFNLDGYWHAGTYESPEDLKRFANAVYPTKGIAVIGGSSVIEWCEPILDALFITYITAARVPGGAFEGDVRAPGNALLEQFPDERWMHRAGSTLFTKRTRNEEALAA